MDVFDRVVAGIESAFNLGSGIYGFGYSRKLQQQIFEREDNAVQRRAADLAKAGLSKTLAAGSAAGAGSTVSVESPQMSLLDRLATAKQMEKTDAETRYTANLAANEAKKNLIMDEELKNMVANRSLIEAKTLLEKGNYELLGYRKDYLASLLNQAEETTKKIISERNLNIQEAVNKGIYAQVMEQQLANLIADCKMKEMENYFMSHTGFKMGVSGTGLVGSSRAGAVLVGDNSPFYSVI